MADLCDVLPWMTFAIPTAMADLCSVLLPWLIVIRVSLFGQLELVQTNMPAKQTVEPVGPVQPGKETTITVHLVVPSEQGEQSFCVCVCVNFTVSPLVFLIWEDAKRIVFHQHTSLFVDFEVLGRDTNVGERCQNNTVFQNNHSVNVKGCCLKEGRKIREIGNCM